ncbi:hypothetical protein CIB84_016089 [Bambusicola thoracicus]|uniref:BTB domain-containing protein n=1 Tax=Bambusicola thoracicus TaxID=9083 RepID=A0A2P4S7T0_BAMTH|nr:hypothetical protein CIB84_016089 [Bambusicola thoracicus]
MAAAGGGAPVEAPPAATGAAAATATAGAESGAVLQREPLYNWQATKGSLRERFAFLFSNELLSDVHFVVGKGGPRGGGAGGAPPGPGQQRIPAHRFVLAAGSAVFDAMFNGGMATTSAEIELPDVEPAAFLALLRSGPGLRGGAWVGAAVCAARRPCALPAVRPQSGQGRGVPLAACGLLRIPARPSAREAASFRNGRSVKCFGVPSGFLMMCFP